MHQHGYVLVYQPREWRRDRAMARVRPGKESVGRSRWWVGFVWPCGRPAKLGGHCLQLRPKLLKLCRPFRFFKVGAFGIQPEKLSLWPIGCPPDIYIGDESRVRRRAMPAIKIACELLQSASTSNTDVGLQIPAQRRQFALQSLPEVHEGALKIRQH